MSAQLRVLGEVEVWVDERPVSLGHARQRCVLAVLAVDAGRLVTTDQLIDRVWGDRTPGDARGVLYNYLARLRRALAAAQDMTIQRHPGGYVLTVDPSAVDLHRFRHLVDHATTTDDENASALFTQALDLWRGEPFAGLDNEWLDTVRTALVAERLAAELDLTDLRLRRGEHTHFLPEVAARAAAHPFDERPLAQLMLALYRAGRPADAWRHYQNLRRRLVAELGTDPGPDLQRLHQQILANDPALTTTTAPGLTARRLDAERFRQRLRDSGVTTRDVTVSDDLDVVLLQALTTLPRAQSGRAPIGRIWGIPARSIRFTGRDRHLADLRQALVGQRPAVVQALNGMGGVGKTTFALEYAHRHATEYDIAWWISAEQPDLIPDRLATLAHALDLADPTDSAAVALARLLGELRTRDRWLLVFDNAEDPTALVPFLPGGSGHVVITSRNPRWDALATSVEVGEFTRSESVALLRTRLPQLGDVDADRLAQALGDLPLAVDHAAALLADTGWTTQHYLDLLQRHTRQLLGRRDQSGGYPVSVAAAWQITADNLTHTNTAAMQLLTLSAWLAPEPVPLTVFTEHPTLLPEPLATAAADRLAWVDLLELLRQRAAARVSPDSLLLHRVPAALLRAHSPGPNPPAEWTTLATTVLAALAPADPWNQPATWPVWQALLPHVLTVTDTSRAPDTSVNTDVDLLLDYMAIYLHTRGEPRAALPHAARAYSRRRACLGDAHPDTLVSANNVALDLYALGDYERARDLHQDTLDRTRRVLGDNHPETLTSANGLARDLYALGDYERARDLHQDAFDRSRTALGDNDPFTLVFASNLGNDLYAFGDYERARDFHQDILDRRRRVLGENHPDTLVSANNLARDLYALGDYERAYDLHQNTLERRRHVLGENHPYALVSADGLARDLYALGDYDQACNLDRDTLARRRHVLGENHPDTLVSATNLALDLDALGARETHELKKTRNTAHSTQDH